MDEISYACLIVDCLIPHIFDCSQDIVHPVYKHNFGFKKSKTILFFFTKLLLSSETPGQTLNTDWLCVCHLVQSEVRIYLQLFYECLMTVL